MSDATPENTKAKPFARILLEDSAAARVALLLDLSIMTADSFGVFEQAGPLPKAGEKDLMVQITEDGKVLAMFVRSDAVEALREAGYDI